MNASTKNHARLQRESFRTGAFLVEESAERCRTKACSKVLHYVMANGIPVRLSADLAARARSIASTQERSLTEQVEHWARLGQVVEDAIMAATVKRLKARSYDPDLAVRLARAMSAEGRAQAADLVRSRNPVRHGIGRDGAIRVERATTSRKKRR
jgi:hypothetical protein